jgi:hypothetical protein
MQESEPQLPELDVDRIVEQRAKQRLALALSAGAWSVAEHPELVHGGAEYVDAIRSERDERFEDAIRSVTADE